MQGGSQRVNFVHGGLARSGVYRDKLIKALKSRFDNVVRGFIGNILGSYACVPEGDDGNIFVLVFV